MLYTCTCTTTKTWVASNGDVPLVEFMYLVFTRMPGESYRRRLRSLVLCYMFRALTNSLVCWFWTSALGLVLALINNNHNACVRNVFVRVSLRDITIWILRCSSFILTIFLSSSSSSSSSSKLSLWLQFGSDFKTITIVVVIITMGVSVVIDV